MIDAFADISSACRLDVPEEHRRPIAVVGAGAIVDAAHLPAYRAGGLDVVGITDIDQDKARAVAERHGIRTVYPNLDALLADREVAVVDVAVPTSAQHEIVQRALTSGRHVLAQKPFAHMAQDASTLVDLADERSLVLAVNQQMRYDEGVAAAHRMVEAGWIGEVSALSITVNIWTEWRDWPWMLDTPRLEVYNHSIHYHDLVRWFLGEPATVHAAAGLTAGQAPRGETRTVTTTTYSSGAIGLVHANHENATGDDTATFRIDGSAGAIRGTLGLLYDYPHGRPDTLEVSSSVVPTDGWVPYPVTQRWIPDAFIGTMGSVLTAAAGGPEPLSSGRDNLGTLAVVEAIYGSIDTGQTVVLDAGQSKTTRHTPPSTGSSAR